MNRKFKSYEYRSTLVCVDSYGHSEMTGRLYNVFHSEGERFESLMQFLLIMERMLDTMVFPQAFSARRSFNQAPNPVAAGPPGTERVGGKLASFELRILFRQNASWQGSVTWLDTGQEENFRSVLELAFLMNSALTPPQQDQEPA